MPQAYLKEAMSKFSDIYTAVSVQLCQVLLSVCPWVCEVLLHWAAYAAKKGIVKLIMYKFYEIG